MCSWRRNRPRNSSAWKRSQGWRSISPPTWRAPSPARSLPSTGDGRRLEVVRPLRHNPNTSTMAGPDPAIHLSANTMPAGYVYILASKKNGTLYIGITSNLPSRMEQHRRGEGSAFVKKYRVTRLVYYELY